MAKSIDKEELEALLATHTKPEIAGRFGITAKSVTRLIRQYGLPNPAYYQSEETKQRRAKAVKAAHQRIPDLTARKVRGFKAHNEKIKGNHWEDVYSPEQAARMKEHMSQVRRGKPVKRKPREGPKLCSICGESVEPGKGKQQQSYCKSCMSIYFKAYYQERKSHYRELTNESRRKRQKEWRDYLSELKRQPCKDCGQTYPPYCLDFDHLNFEEKVATIPELVVSNASKERVLAEIAKTEVVCANCHRRREHLRYAQSGKKPVHLSPRQRQNKMLIERAKNQPCKDCGGSFSAWQMDFDHVQGKKVRNVGHLAMSGTTESMVEEMDKCDVVCANCHRKRTFKKMA